MMDFLSYGRLLIVILRWMDDEKQVSSRMGSPLEFSNDYRSHEEKNQEKEKNY